MPAFEKRHPAGMTTTGHREKGGELKEERFAFVPIMFVEDLWTY